MQTKRIKCPNCGVVLDVRNSRNEAIKVIRCPQCQAGLRVHFAPVAAPQPGQPAQPAGGHTVLPGAGGGYAPKPGETQLGRRPQPAGRTATPCLVCEGRDYPLSVGTNTIGRRATTSTATVQIATDDLYMSRSHARIDVSTLPGGGLKVVIRNDKNKNTTTVGGQPLVGEDALVLRSGTPIVMGKTSLVYIEK